MKSNACKLIQRQMYTVLSHKYGTTIIFLAIVLVVVSAFQFGETVMEWSYVQYINMFSSFTDNVAGVSFKNRLCSPIPIDAVYTWVNGSDPSLLLQIRHIEMDLKKQINGIRDNCTFSHCIPANLIVVEPEFSTKLPFEELKLKYKIFNMAINMFSLNFTGEHHKFTVINYPDEKSVLKAIEFQTEIKDQPNTIIKRGYYTSDWTLQQSVLLSDTVLMTGLTKNVKLKSIKNLLYKNKITFSKIDLYSTQQLAVIRLPSKEVMEELLQVNLTFDSKNITLVVANLVWDLTDYSENEDTSRSRFEDNEELRYSLRSIDRFAPWIRHVFIVTNGQIPLWLNLDSPRLTLVTHADIFPNISHLPTFSSPGIEANLHRIPGLSDKFIYLNDDVMFGKEVWPDDFYSHSTGQKVYLTWPIPSCDENCPNTWIKDGYCDKHCNNSQCDWDGGDCEGKTDTEPHSRNYWVGDLSFRSDVKLIYCSVGCANSWLGDRYCDDPCNVYECGFDMGDCGTQQYNQIYRIDFVPGRDTYQVDPGQNIFYFNLSSLLGEDDRVESANMNKDKIIRSAIISQIFKVMTLLLYPNHTATLNFYLTTHEKNTNHTKQSNLTVMVDTKVIKSSHGLSTTKSNSSPKNLTTPTTPAVLPENKEIVFPNISTQQLHPKPKNVSSIFFQTDFSNYNLSNEIQEKLDILNKSYIDGDLTQKGYEIRRYVLWKKLMQTYTTKVPQSFHVKKLSDKSLQSKDKMILNLKQSTAKMIVDKKEWQTTQEQLKVPNGPARRHLLSLSENINKPGVFPWEKSNALIFKLQKEWERIQMYKTVSKSQRKLFDTFGDSIRHVNRLYNKAFGYTSRKVLAHIPHMIDKHVMKELQDLFPAEWDVTSSHRIRSSDDMQFAFAYFYYLMGVTIDVDPAEIFDDTDTDKSGVLSDREFRTLATRLYNLPLDLVTLSNLEEKIINCSVNYSEPENELPEEIQEKYYETKMPQMTKDFFLCCPTLIDAIKANFKPQPKYKYIIHEDHETIFQMIKTNISAAVSQLDRIRKDPKKFICLNDNIDHAKQEAQTVKAILKDFFESMYPIPSRFELPREYRNRFLHIDELREWRVYRSWLRFWTYLTLTILVLLALMSFCSDYIESAHRRIFPHRLRSGHCLDQQNAKEKEQKTSFTQNEDDFSCHV